MENYPQITQIPQKNTSRHDQHFNSNSSSCGKTNTIHEITRNHTKWIH
jgi:hypothetical protein